MTSVFYSQEDKKQTVPNRAVDVIWSCKFSLSAMLALQSCPGCCIVAGDGPFEKVSTY